MFSALRFLTEEISRAGRIMAKAARFREERTGKHSNYLGGETSVDGVPPFQRQHGGMIGASTGSYVYPRICGSFFLSFFFFARLFPYSPPFSFRLFLVCRFTAAEALFPNAPSRASLILRPFPGRFTWLDSTPQWKAFHFISSFRIFLGVTSPIPYIVTRLFSNIIIIYLTIRIYNRKHGFVFLNQFSLTYIYICIKYPRERTTFSPNPVPSPHEDASHSERDRGGILIPRKFGSPASCT